MEYSLNNGSSWVDAGSLIDFNGYTGTLFTEGGNPLAGRSAFVGSSHGYISTRLNMASLAGKTVTFRWRMGLDESGNAWGWWVDNVKVYTCGVATAFDRDTTGVFRPSNGLLYLKNSNTTGFADVAINYGLPGDYPVVGDWDGNGTPELNFALGNPGDVGIAGDWNGDGLDTTGVFRPSNGVIFLKNTNSTGFADVALNYGIPGDQPVMGDWNNDGVDTIGIYRNGTFYLRNSNTVGFADIVFGLGNPGDMPIAGNWDALP